MSVSLHSEPAVLARAKEFLLAEIEYSYAVVDTQFSSGSWGESTIPDGIHQSLQPMNALTLGNGRPDALVAPPRPEVYRDPAAGGPDLVPLAVVEAKGETRGSHNNADRIGLTQAHAHLEEANVAFTALPSSLVRERTRALARELNVGLIVVGENDVELVETPRLVGSQASETTDTVRFHARVGGIAVENLQKNHPKNAIGYALAVAHDEPTDDVFKRYVIKSVSHARGDATALGLVDERFDRQSLTDLGRESVRTLTYHYGGVESALETVDDLHRSSTRLIDEQPALGIVARQALLAYPPTQVLVDTISELMHDGICEPSLSTVAQSIADERPEFALDLFVPSPRRSEVVTDRGGVDSSEFDRSAIYATHTTYQYKGMLWHAGVLSTRGEDTKADLDPTSEVWALETTI